MALLLLSASMSAQGTRQINGCVMDADGLPLSGATVTLKNSGKSVQTGADGRFLLDVAVYEKYLVATKEGYFSQELENDGSFLIFKLKYNKKYQEEKARREVEKRKAEEQARIDSVNRARAEAAAKIRAEAAKKAAEEQARKEDEAKAKAEAAAKARAEKKARIQKLDDEYSQKYKNRGLINSIELSYNYQIASGELIFLNAGYFEYGNLNPIELDYQIGYRFNRFFSLSGGIGVMALCGAFSIASYDSLQNGETLFTMDYPLYVNTKLYFARGKVQPMISLSGGAYILTKSFMMEAGLGCSVRLARIFNMNILASLRTTPWPSYQKDSNINYPAVFSPGIKIGFTL